MKRIWQSGLLMMSLCVFAFVVSASADTMELKDRRVLSGKYEGGTARSVRFEVDGKVEVFQVADILAITFTGNAGTIDEGAAPPPSTTPGGSQRVTVPAGTRLLVRMIDSVDSEKNHVGDRFRASLDTDLTVGDVLVAPKGTDLYGRLAEAKEAGHMAGKSELKLELTDIVINQQAQPIMTGDYEVAGKGRGGNTAKKVGGGAALGAIIGGIAGGGRGAAIGAGVGAGAGATIQVLTRGQQVRVPSETMLEFRITQAFTVEPVRSPTH